MKSRLLKLILFVFILPLSFITFQGASADDSDVYYAKIEGEISPGLYKYIERAVRTAEKGGAKLIIFDMDTFGGRIDAAMDIGDLLTKTDVKTVVYINPNAISAGAYIALNMDEIYWAPNGKMGAATPITSDGNAADDKTMSLWKESMRDSAERGGRDPNYAEAMVDKSVSLPENVKKDGELLTLSASQALEIGYADGIAENLSELYQTLGIDEGKIEEVEKTWSEKIAEFLTNSIVVPILLSIGSLGLVLELYSPGFGVPGFMGISSLLLFFYGHFIAGFAGYESLILFLVGLVLIILEIFLPGGILGILGLGGIILSILLAGKSVVEMAIYLVIAITIAIAAMVILMKYFGKKIQIFNKLILRDSTNTEQGYVSNKTRTDLLGKVGVSITPLRPSGTALFGNERIDVVTEGSFIPSDQKVIVVSVEGVRVVVREYKEEE